MKARKLSTEDVVLLAFTRPFDAANNAFGALGQFEIWTTITHCFLREVYRPADDYPSDRFTSF